METIVNHDKKIIISALPRCGTQYLAKQAVNKPEWHALNIRQYKLLKNYNEYTVYLPVRDPYKRWRSWFYSFVNDTATDPEWPKQWSVLVAHDWLQTFSLRMHYDTHTGLQSILYNVELPSSVKNIRYVHMEDIGTLMYGKPRYTPANGLGHLEDMLPADTSAYFDRTVPLLYQHDYKWIESLTFWNPVVDKSA